MKKLQKKAEGYWFYPVTDFVYDKSYIDKYKTYAITPMGNKILKARLDILKQYTNYYNSYKSLFLAINKVLLPSTFVNTLL